MRFDRNPDYWKPGRPISTGSLRASSTTAARAPPPSRPAKCRSRGFNVDALPLDVKRLQAVAADRGHVEGLRDAVAHRRARPQHAQASRSTTSKVRQAIAYAIDRKFIIDNVWFGFGKPATGPISSNFKANGLYTADVHRLHRGQRHRAGQQAARRGRLPDEGRRHALRDHARHHAATARNGSRFGEAVQQQLGKVGIKVDLRYEDVPTWLRRVYTELRLTRMTSNWIQTLADPVIGVHRALPLEDDQAGHRVRERLPAGARSETDELMDKATVEVGSRRSATTSITSSRKTSSRRRRSSR